MSEERLARVRDLSKLAGELNTSLATLSIAWCLANPNVTTAILGATKPAQLTENLGALEVLPKLTPEVMEQIDTIMGTKPVLPQY